MTDRVNLWITPQPGEAGAVPPDGTGHGPAAPGSRPSAVPGRADTLPPPPDPVRRPATAAWWALGVHGGAGVTSLLRALGSGADAGGRWPDVQGAPGGVPVLLVARTDARGLDAAQAALQEWDRGTVPASAVLLGLALLADAPARPGRGLRERIRTLSGAVPRLWQVPWIPAWRDGAEPRRPVRALLELAEAVRGLAPAGVPAPAPAAPGPAVAPGAAFGAVSVPSRSPAPDDRGAEAGTPGANSLQKAPARPVLAAPTRTATAAWLTPLVPAGPPARQSPAGRHHTLRPVEETR
ncbi:DUF6668 family protein [Streptomyces sp. NPDC001380]|uniref:DUF6668 family protein n=1 Tax=Streptomyces sp. NPDC001380 TaxID=3364566 RepID=UPI0036BF4BD5